MAFKIPESVLVVIHTADLQVLLIERARHPGFWQSVTGSLDAPGEAPAAAAAREVLEETGIDAGAPGHQLRDWQHSVRYEIFEQWRQRYAPGVTHNLEHLFSLQVPQARPVRLAPAEHRAQQWLPWQQAAQCCFSWSNQDAIRRVAAAAGAAPG